MRKLIFGINLTIDGGCEHSMGIPDAEVHDYFTKLTRDAGVMVYGRKTYELMVPFWPDIAKDPSGQPENIKEFAEAFVSVPRMLVFSKTLEKVESNNATIVRANLKEEILKLKQEPGNSILTGGVDIPTQLIGAGLVDEIHIVVHPVVAGKGRRLFDELQLEEQVKFKLVESKIFKSGCVANRYVK